MSEEKKNCGVPSNDEPTANRSTVPMWIIVVTLVLLYFGFVYFDRSGGWFNSKIYAPYISAEELDAYQPKSGAAQMLARGKQVYEQVCGLCHGNDGAGKPGQAPPLAGSEWVIAKGYQRLAHIPLEGLNGQITVEGKEWNMSMAAMGAALSDADMAAVLTYIRGSWGNKADAVTADDVKSTRAAMGAHPQPISGQDQLKALPE